MLQVPQYVSSKPSSSLVYKLVELIGLSLYWDTNNERVSSAEHLREMSHTTQHHKYLLEPVSGRALVKRNTTPQPLRSQVSPYSLYMFIYQTWALACVGRWGRGSKM